MPLPNKENLNFANWFFAQKAQPIGTLATKNDALKFSTKIPQVKDVMGGGGGEEREERGKGERRGRE